MNQLYQDNFRKVLEQSSMLLILDKHKKISYANNNFCHFFQYNISEIIGKSLEIIHSEVYCKLLFAMQSEHLKLGKQYKEQLFAVKKNSTRIWVEINLMPFLDEKNEIVEYFVLFQDISLHKNIEFELLETQKRFDLLSKATFESITLLENGICIEANEATSKLLGYSRQELIGMEAMEVIDVPFREIVRYNIQNRFEDTYQVMALHKNGTAFPVEIQGKMVFHEGKEIRVTSLRDISYRKNAEQIILKQEANLQAIINNTHFSIWSIDTSLRLVIANKKFYSDYELFFGKTIQLGEIIVDGFEKTVATLWRGYYEKALKGKRFLREIVHKDNYYEVSFSPIFENNLIIGVAAYAHNINNRKNFEKKIIESKQILEENQDFAKLGTWYFDLLTQKVTWSKYVFLSFGLNPEGYTPDYPSYISLVHPEDFPLLAKSIEKAIQFGKDYEIEVRHQQPDKSYKWVLVRAKSINDEENNTVALSGIVMDIDFTKRMMLINKDLDSKIRTLFNTNLIGIAITDQNKKVLQCNTEYAEIIGYSEEELQNIDWKAITHPANMERDLQLLQKVYLKEIDAYNIEKKYIRKDKQVIDVEVSMQCIRHENGDIHYFLVLIKDISDRKQAEAAILNAFDKLQKLNEELSDREEEISANEEELLKVNQILSKANEELTKTNEELDRFVYSASHDLRAPIASMMGLITISRMTDDINQIYEYLHLQEISIQKLDNFIRDILDYSQNARTELNIELIEFKTLFANVFEQYNYLENSDKIEKIIEIHQQEDFYSDARRLNIIFNNIVSNAIRYANIHQSKSFIHVYVLIEAQKVSIEVKDNGIGIGKEHLPKIFDMFYRANAQKLGSGLGLYIVKEAIQKLNGTISIQSELNMGTHISLEIPNLSNHTPENE